MNIIPQTVLVIHDYELPGKGFLPVRKNDIIYVIEADPSGWWLGCNTHGKKGVFPSTYTIPYKVEFPSDNVKRELEFISLGEKFSLDLISGVPYPALLETETVIPPESKLIKGTYEVSKSIEENILYREDLRCNILSKLEELHRSQLSLESCSQSRQAKGVNVDTFNDRTKETSEALETLINAIDREKRKFDSEERMPQLSWYMRYFDIKEASGINNLTILALETQLKDLQRKIQRKESTLSSLSAQVNRIEAKYLKEKKKVTERIYVRDALIVEFLQFWEKQASKEKEQYLSLKQQQHHQGNLLNVEADLTTTIEQKRVEYDNLVEKYQRLRNSMKYVKQMLLQREEVSKLDEEIKHINGDIALIG